MDRDTTGIQDPAHPDNDELTARPVEMEARQRDSATLAGNDGARPTEVLNVYRLVPIAEADDPRWDNSPFQGIVVVAARSSGDARLIAAARELDYMEIDAKPAEDVTTNMASAFRSDKLYTVIEVDRDRADLTRGVLEGGVSVDTIKPVQM
ncbi:hypothetical protein ASE36_07725 [Rhizobium sp. Root274]|uniref:hypothetical protein n=1 Tax=unclassified Rhizobium TaxID=2613769 RepID=UPI000715D6B8|nr:MULTISPECIES: hypothetical protein [unclassified Rhizobium]KQW32076.1 hypothetical protein ASC71_07735 [Rhizobium sp. Root1240]KRD33613.1 hypothetical protein ASE36_07725 [Rhizobium sp. Root274]